MLAPTGICDRCWTRHVMIVCLLVFTIIFTLFTLPAMPGLWSANCPSMDKAAVRNSAWHGVRFEGQRGSAVGRGGGGMPAVALAGCSKSLWHCHCHCHCDWHWHCANSGLFIVNPGSRKLFAHVPHLSIIIDVHCLSILYCTKYRYCLNLDEPTRSNPPSCLSTHKWFIPVPTFYHGSGDINTNHSLFFAGTVFSLVWSFLAVIRACRVLKILSNSVYSVYRYQTR